MLMRIGTLTSFTGAHQEKIWGLNVIEERHGLTRVNKHQNLFVHSFQMHFLVYFGKILRLKDLSILNLEEILTSMAIRIHENL